LWLEKKQKGRESRAFLLGAYLLQELPASRERDAPWRAIFSILFSFTVTAFREDQVTVSFWRT